MPTYEYACKSCGEHLEVVQSFKEDPLTSCAACGGQLRKVFGNIGISFKGSGFYKNDSRSSSTPAKADGAGKAPAKDGAAKDGAAKDGAAKDGAAKDGGTSGAGTAAPATASAAAS